MFYVFKADEIHKNEGSLEILASGMTSGREKALLLFLCFLFFNCTSIFFFFLFLMAA